MPSNFDSYLGSHESSLSLYDGNYFYAYKTGRVHNPNIGRYWKGGDIVVLKLDMEKRIMSATVNSVDYGVLNSHVELPPKVLFAITMQNCSLKISHKFL